MVSDRTPPHSSMPAPCIVDTGTVVNKQDIKRLLCDVGAVRYHYSHGGQCISEGEGYVIEVFADASEATLVTNHSLYINVCSFDYLELSRTPLPTPSLPATPPATDTAAPGAGTQIEAQKDTPQNAYPVTPSPRYESCFDLVQENMRLRLVPLSNPLKVRCSRSMNSVALDAVVADMLSSNFDLGDDDDSFLV